MGRIVLASGQIFRSDFCPPDEIFRPGMPFRPLYEQAHLVTLVPLVMASLLVQKIENCSNFETAQNTRNQQFQ